MIFKLKIVIIQLFNDDRIHFEVYLYWCVRTITNVYDVYTFIQYVGNIDDTHIHRRTILKLALYDFLQFTSYPPVTQTDDIESRELHRQNHSTNLSVQTSPT